MVVGAKGVCREEGDRAVDEAGVSGKREVSMVLAECEVETAR